MNSKFTFQHHYHFANKRDLLWLLKHTGTKTQGIKAPRKVSFKHALRAEGGR